MASAFNLTAQINLQGPTNLKPIVSNIKKELSGIKATVDLEVKASSAKNITAINSKLKELSKFATNANTSIKDLNASLTSLSNSFTKLSNAGSATTAGIESTNKSIGTTKKAISEATTEIEEFGKQSGLAIRRFAAFSTVTSVVYGLVNAFNSAFKEFVNFNREVVKLSQVTGQSVSDLKGISDEIGRLSTSLGVASSDLIAVASTLAQAGLSAEDTRVALEALAKSALAPSFDSITETAEGSIAVLRQFGLQASELESALGSINAVAAAFAVEAGDLVTAIQRTGGVFASSSKGVTEGKDALNEFLAVFTSVRQTTRESAETIATGLRTIFTRIQRADTIKQLREFGVELTDLEGKFVGPFEAIKRLSEGLSRLDPRDISFSNIIEELGGFRQIGKVIPLIQQFAVAQEALKVAQRGQDSLAKDAAVAQESLSNRFAKTRESFLALVRDIGDSGTFRALADVTLTLANSLITLGKALEPLLPLLVTFGAIKIGSSLTQFASGFRRGFGGGGGAGSSPTAPSGPGPTTPSGNQKSETLIASNTTALSALVAPINNLLQSINTINATINQTNTLLKTRPLTGGAPKAFARGGLVPGRGSRDTVPAMLTPGEFVIRKKAVQALGLGRLTQMNRYAGGGKIKNNSFFKILNPQKFANGGIAKILRQNVIASAILRDSSFSREPLANSKRKILKSVGSYLNDNEKIAVPNYELVREGVDPDLRTNFTKSIKKGFIRGLESAISFASSDIGLPSIKLSRTRGNVPNFFKSINDAAIGNLFEDVLSTIEKSGLFPTAENPRRPFDFTTGLQSALAARLFPRISSSGIQYVDAKASRKAAGPSGMLNKLIEQIKLEHPGGPISTQNIAQKENTIQDAILRDLTLAKSSGRTLTDLKQSITIPNNFKKLINEEILNQMVLSNLIEKSGRRFKVRGFAQGGSISAKDTVPALLTPGEFVINKKAAQRIGYGNLKRLNYADRIRGYNKGGIVGTQKLNTGGIVQRFANGGIVGDRNVDATDIFALSSIFTSVLQPQIEKLATSFKDLDGTVSDTAIGFAKSIQELSSNVSSAAIALSVVGANTQQRRAIIGQAAGFGAIGGAISGFNTQKLEDAVQQNTKAINAFEGSFRDFQQATIPEEVARSSEQVQKNFAILSKTLESNNRSITSAETWKAFGDAMTSASASTLALQTGLLALNGAFATSTAAILREAQARSISPTVAKWTQLGGSSAAAAATAAPLAKTASVFSRLSTIIGPIILGATKFLGVIGLIITAGQILYSVFNIFSRSSSKAAEDAIKLSEALQKATAANRDVTVANQRYRNEVLKQFQDLKKNNTPAQLERILGSVSSTPVPGSSSQQIRVGGGEFTFVLNELNSSFRTFFAKEAANRQIQLDSTSSIRDSLQQLIDVGLSEDVNRLLADLPKIFERYLSSQFIAARTRDGSTSAENAGKEFEKLFKQGTKGIQQIVDIVEPFAGSVELAKQNLDLAQLAAREITIKFSNLSSISNSLIASLSAMSNAIENNNKSLQTSINILQGQAQVPNDNVFRRNAQVLSNVRGSTTEQIKAAVDSTISSLSPKSIIPLTQESVKKQENIINELRTGFSVLKALESGLPTLLNNVNIDPSNTDGIKIFTTGIASILRESAQLNIDQANEIAKSIGTFVKEESPKGAVTAQQIIDKFGSLGSTLESAVVTQKTLTAVNEEAAKVLDIVNQNANEYAQTILKINQLELRRVQSQQETAQELSKVLGREISGADINKAFQQQIRTITGGPISVTDISRLSDDLVDEIDTITQQLRNLNPIQDQKLFADLTKQQASAVAQYQKTNTALELIANSSEKLKNAFDKLAEKEKKLFSGPQSVLEEFIKDPIKAKEIAKILSGPLARLQAGRATASDITQIAQSDIRRLLEEIGNTTAANDIANAITAGFAKLGFGESVQNRDIGGVVASLDILVKNFAQQIPTLKGLFLGPEVKAVTNIQAERDAALNKTITNLDRVIGLLSSEGITKPLQDLSASLPGIIQQRLSEELLYIETIRKIRTESTSAQTSQQDSRTGVTSTLINKINTTIDVLNKSRFQRQVIIGNRREFIEIQFQKIPEIASLEEAVSIVTSKILPVVISLEKEVKSGTAGRTTSSALGGGVSLKDAPGAELLSNTFSNLIKIIKILNLTIEQQNTQQQKSTLSPFTQPPAGSRGDISRPGTQGQPGAAPGLLDTSQLKTTFNNFVGSLSEALTAQSETFGQNLILQLSGAFSSFDKTVNIFKNSSEVLVAKLNDFNARGGIKGPNIPQQVSVNVAFDDELTVVAQNNNAALLNDITTLVSDAVTNQLNRLRIFG